MSAPTRRINILQERKKKLCLLVPSHWSANFGGSEYQVRCLLDALLVRGTFDISYLARKFRPDFTPIGYTLERIGTGRGIARHGYFFDSARLMWVLKRIQPDVIYQRVADIIRETGSGYIIPATSDWGEALRDLLQEFVNGMSPPERNEEAIEAYAWKNISKQWIGVIAGTQYDSPPQDDDKVTSSQQSQ